MKELRELLAAAAADPRGAQLFSSLYPCWSHSPAALLTLCFLARAYEHSCDVISSFTALPVYTDMLVQLDRLVQVGVLWHACLFKRALVNEVATNLDLASK